MRALNRIQAQQVLDQINKYFRLKLDLVDGQKEFPRNIYCRDRKGKNHVIIGYPEGKNYILQGIVRRTGQQCMSWQADGRAGEGCSQVGEWTADPIIFPLEPVSVSQ